MGVVVNPPSPGSEEWRRTITASKIADFIRYPNGEYAGLGYNSAYERWLDMRGEYQQAVSFVEQQMFDDAHDAEPSAIARFQRAYPEFEILPPRVRDDGVMTREVAFTDESLPFPNLATADAVAVDHDAGVVIPIECKRPRFDNGVEFKWVLQNTMQCALMGAPYGFIILDPVWGEVSINKINFNADLWGKIIDDCKHFWDLVESGVRPDVEWTEELKDIQKYFHPVTSGKVFELPIDMAQNYQRLTQKIKELEKVKASIVMSMGDASSVKADGVTIAERKRRFNAKFFKEQYPEIAEKYSMRGKMDSAAIKKNHPEEYDSARTSVAISFF